MNLISKFSCIVFCLLLTNSRNICAQHRSDIWCFGHNAAINFINGTNPTIDSSAVVSRGSCASICDSMGQLQFYVANDSNPISIQRGLVYQRNGIIMPNGDSLIGRAWYQEHIIVPDPTDTNMYYVFSCGHSDIHGFYYSKIDLNQNGGFGDVTQKNVQLQSLRSADCVVAIKHGNGRDWWIIFRSIDALPNNDWYEYLVTPNGISNVQAISVGTLNVAGFARFCVNSEGNKLAFVNAGGLVEVYNFNRCNGVIDNPVTIDTQPSSPPYPWYWECAFSPNSNLLYVTSDTYECVLVQYNLLDSNPSATKDTLWDITFPVGALGAVRRAPDNKLYVSCAYIDSMGSWNYPYPDSVYNMYNMNLSVINQPDSLGAACNFQPYSFYLGGKRTYWGLPNNPDYDLGRDSGSVCDTLQWMGINEQEATGKGQLQVTYISSWEKLFVNAQNIKGKNALLRIYDLNGRVVFSSQRKTQPPYYTQDVDVSSLSSGMYVVHLLTEKEMLCKKFVKN